MNQLASQCYILLCYSAQLRTQRKPDLSAYNLRPVGPLQPSCVLPPALCGRSLTRGDSLDDGSLAERASVAVYFAMAQPEQICPALTRLYWIGKL